MMYLHPKGLEVLIPWCLPHLRICLQTSSHPLLEVVLHPLRSAIEIKSEIRYRAMKKYLSCLRPDAER